MRLLVFSLIFIFGLGAGILSSQLFLKPAEFSSKQVRQGGYRYINPLLECEVGFNPQNSFGEIRVVLEDVIDNLKSRGAIEEASIYLRDLNNGPYIGINDEEEFSPASLLKLPIMIAYYKQAERQPGYLNTKAKLVVEKDYNSWESIKSSKYLKIGEEYTYDQLIDAMMLYSDNNAMAILSQQMSLDLQDEVYKALGVTIPGSQGINDFMSVRQYASFFRILYNSSYLEPESSEKILQTLTDIEYKDGIRAGIPSSTAVSHKFGERVVNDKTQLHDCGIVYIEDNPLLLCIMTRGDDLDELTGAIRDISAIIYRDISTQ